MISPRTSPDAPPGPIGETARARLEIFVGLLRKWNPAINLVSASSLQGVWERHVLDSAQLSRFLTDDVRIWADLGSGGGFPGVVVAAIAADQHPLARFILVESDQRKATFLQTVSRETGLPIQIICERIEDVAPLGADILSARALAPLNRLCLAADRHLKPGGRAIFLKGARAGEEVDAARADWRFDLKCHPSTVDPSGTILELSALSHV